MHCEVAIVGAGMAGLGAAATLIKNGFNNILVIEAQNEIGGRIRTLRVGDGVVELGAQWVHGVDTDLYALAEENGLIHEESSDEGSGIYIRDDGFVFDDFLVQRVSFEVGKILEECEVFVDAEHYPISIGDYLEKKFGEFVKKWNDKSEIWDNNKKCFDNKEEFADNKNQFLDDTKLSDNNKKVSDNKNEFLDNKKIVSDKNEQFWDNKKQQLSDNNGKHLVNDNTQLWQLYDWNVRFQLIDNACSDLKQLSAREWGRYSCLGKDGQSHINLKGGYGALVDVLIKNLPKNIFVLNTPVNRIIYENMEMKLETQDGKSVMAKHVILTASLGVLKECKGLVESLNDGLKLSINSMGFGGIGKVFLLFDVKWWKCKGFQLIWGHRSCEGNWNWSRHLSGFDLVLDQPNMLVGWLSAPGVQEMENLTPTQVGRDCTNLLRTFLQRDDIPYPIKVFKTNWKSCQWVRGAYSHTTPECDRTKSSATTLLQPVHFKGIPRVLLAGEAAHVSQFSTTHGAYASGKQQANVILNFYKNNVTK